MSGNSEKQRWNVPNMFIRFGTFITLISLLSACSSSTTTTPDYTKVQPLPNMQTYNYTPSKIPDIPIQVACGSDCEDEAQAAWDDDRRREDDYYYEQQQEQAAWDEEHDS